MSNAAQTLSVRGFKLASILDKKHGGLELILRVLDLENELAEARNEVNSLRLELSRCSEEEELPNSVQIEEFANEAGYLTSPPNESVWIESLSNKTGLDVRAILSPLPKELGLYPFRFAYKQDGKMICASLKVWIIPVQEGN